MPSNGPAPDLTSLRQAVSASGEVIFMTDRDGTFTFVNPRFERLYGYAAAEVIGHATPRILKGGTVEPAEYTALWNRLLRGQSVERTFVNRTKDGRLVDVEATISPIQGSDGSLVGFLAIQRDITARRQAEAALRLERDRAQRYLDVADVMLVALDNHGRISMINRRGCAILEADERDLIGRDWIETCVPPRLRDAMTEKFHNLLAGDLSLVENPVLTRSGKERIMGWRNTLLRDASGRVFGTLSSGEDITERREAERALRESQAQLQLISDNVLDLVSQIRLDGTYVYASPSYQVLLGYAPETLVGTSAFTLVHPDDRGRVRAVIDEAVRQRTTGRAEFRSLRADGTYVWLESVGKLLFDTSNVPNGAILSTRDITERKRSEEERREYDRRLEIAVASADMAVFTQDGHLRYTWLHNPPLGIQARHAVGKTDADLLPPSLAGQVTAIKQRAIETGERTRAEVTGDVNGQPRYLDLIVEPLRNPAGKIEGLIGAALDTTARRQLETQLRQAQKLESIGSLAGGIAHDFNNLLTAIMGYADLALDGIAPDDPARRDIEEIIRAGRSAESLTRQLLIFSRKSIIQPVLLNLNDTVARLDNILRRLVGEHIEFDLQLGRGLGSVRMDAGQLDQVLMNLVVNARDAMPMGGQLTIWTGTRRLDDTFVRSHGGTAPGLFDFLSVTDTGTGMTPEVQAQVFDPFFTTKGPEKGTGLGLATVHGIAEQAGGYVDVESAPGQGTTFVVYLPRDGGARPAAAAAAVGTTRPAGRERILFVEDNSGIRTMAARALGGYGYIVIAARNASDAIARVASEPIDLLITDIVMPGRNGRELADELRTAQPGLKVIYTSGFTDDSALLQGIRSGGTPFLQKPYTLESLARIVRRVLDDGGKDSDAVG